METAVATALLVMGLAIAAIWTRDIVVAEKVDVSRGLLAARDSDGSLFLPHWIAEFGTAGLLIVGGTGLLMEASWAGAVASLGSGALFYTSINSLGWALADRERYSYAAPMFGGVVVSVVAAIYLIVG